MIKYTLRCGVGHGFESWFQSGTAFETLHSQKLLTCPECGSSDISKALMAPAVASARRAEVVKNAAPVPAAPQTPNSGIALSPAPDMAQKLQALRAQIEANSDYVGTKFASEARAMYLGDIPDRPIYGEARPEEAKALIKDGVPVVPLPFVPSRKAN